MYGRSVGCGVSAGRPHRCSGRQLCEDTDVTDYGTPAAPWGYTGEAYLLQEGGGGGLFTYTDDGEQLASLQNGSAKLYQQIGTYDDNLAVDVSFIAANRADLPVDYKWADGAGVDVKLYSGGTGVDGTLLDSVNWNGVPFDSLAWHAALVSLNTGTSGTSGDALWLSFESSDLTQNYIDSVSAALGLPPTATQAHTPVPANGAPFIDPTTVLSWTAPNAYIDATYDIYFGTTEPNFFDPAPYGLTQLDNSADTSATTIDPVPAGDLDNGTPYHWVVDATDPNTGGTPVLHPGDPWSFGTADYFDPLSEIIKPVSATVTGVPSHRTIVETINDSGLRDNVSGLPTVLLTGDAIPNPPAPSAFPTHDDWALSNWTDAYRHVCDDPNDSFIYELGTIYEVDGCLLWNGFESGGWFGISQITISFSTDGVTFGNEITVYPAMAVGAGGGVYNTEPIFFGATVSATHVKLSNMDNFMGSTDKRVILGEIRFTGYTLLPNISTPPVSQTVVAGTEVTLSVVAENIIGYQWYEETAGLLFGETNSDLVLTNVQELAGEGRYYCAVTNGNPLEDAISVSARVMTERLAARWDFEGDLVDEVIGLVGTYTGAAASYSSDSIEGTQSLDLNAVDPNFVTVDPAGGYLGFTPEGYTVSAWVKVTADPIVAGAILKLYGDGAYGGYSSFWFSLDTAGYTTGGVNSSVVSKEPVLADNGWHQVSLTYDPTTELVKYYVDGALDDEWYDEMIRPTFTGLLILGVGDVTGIGPFVGLLDEVQIYNYARTPIQVAEDYVTTDPTRSVCVDQTGLEFDLNGDCVVGIKDFAEFASDWLNCRRVAGASSGLPDCL